LLVVLYEYITMHEPINIKVQQNIIILGDGLNT